MPAQPITVDKYPMQAHVDWANAQNKLDPAFALASPLNGHQPEILWTSTLHTSQLDDLLHWNQRNIPWAHFETPPHFYSVTHPPFSSSGLRPTVIARQEEEGVSKFEQMKKVIALLHNEGESPALFEQAKTTMVGMIEELQEIGELLAQIYSRTLQYQKG